MLYTYMLGSHLNVHVHPFQQPNKELVAMQDRWRKVPGVQFHHLGQISFRDTNTPEEYTLLQVNSER